MNYKESIEYIEKLQVQKGIDFGLERVKKALKHFGGPQDAIPAIHVAGTNGKGSVCAYLSALLMANGLKTGQFCSPKMEEERDCVSINGQVISKQAFAALVSRITGELPDITLRAFELVTVLAFIYFKEKHCKIIVIEAGMGGLSDATNVIAAPLACVFTPISIDHIQFLGNKITDIAANKCGIIKEDSLVISAPQTEAVKDIIAKHTADITGHNACFIDEADIKIQSQKPDFSNFTYKKRKGIRIKMPGLHQIQNAALAIEVIDRLGFQILPEALPEVCVPGRFETLSLNPRIIIDGAHNGAGAKSLAKTILKLYSDKARIMILGVLSDKDYNDILIETAKCAHHIITVSTSGVRKLSAMELAQAAYAYCKHVTAADSIPEALDLAKTLAGVNGVIIAAGSLTYLPQLRKSIHYRGGSPLVH